MNHSTSEQERILAEAVDMLRGVEGSLHEIDPGEVRRDVWFNEISRLKERIFPTITIAVCGVTGSGKSSLINAILDDHIVATSGDRACTSVVTEIGYHASEGIAADVAFISEDEWRTEIRNLLDDLNNGESPASLVQAAVRKLSAVYPDLKTRQQISAMTENMILQHDPSIPEMLAKRTDKIYADNSQDFLRKTAKYIQSGKRGTSALWPLVQRVRVWCSAPALSTGAILVDLPGVADSNAARMKVAEEYLLKCKYIWVIAPVIRAVDDKAARDLLGAILNRTQLQMDGNYNANKITFVATKTDEILPLEIIASLGLEDDDELQYLEKAITTCKDNIRDHNTTEEMLSSQLKDHDEKCNRLREHLAILEARSPLVTRKRKRPDQDADVMLKLALSPSKAHSNEERRLNSSNNISENEEDNDKNDLKAALELQDARDLCRIAEDQRSQAQKDKINAGEWAAKSKEYFVEARTALMTYCAKKRAEKATETLQQDFRDDMRMINEDGTLVGHDYEDIKLPVFFCSSWDYTSLGENVQDRAVRCFSTKEDCGIPSLREWCHILAAPYRRRGAKRLVLRLRALLESIRGFLTDAGKVTQRDQDALRAQYSAGYPRRRPYHPLLGIACRLTGEFAGVVESCEVDLKKLFRDRLEDTLTEGVAQAIATAVETAESFSQKIPWQTFRAALRRVGIYNGHDLNYDLIQPLMLVIVHSWCSIFEKDLFVDLDKSIMALIQTFLVQFKELAGPSLKDRAVSQADLALREADVELQATLEIVRETMDEEQKKVSRSLVPHIQQELHEVYVDALEEKGRGSVSRQKAIVKKGVEEEKIALFNNAADALYSKLNGAAEGISKTLSSCMEELAKKIEVSLSVLWESQLDTEKLIKAREEIQRLLESVEKQVELTSTWSKS